MGSRLTLPARSANLRASFPNRPVRGSRFFRKELHMKKLLVFALVASGVFAGSARAGSIGVGVFGGTSVPVLQADQDNGTLFGVRAPVKLIPLLTVEPFYSSSALGDKTIDIAPGISTTREGSDVKSYGLNAMLTLGGPVTFYPYAGIGQAKYKRTAQDESFTAYNLGLGLALSPIPKFSIDLRGELQAAVDAGVSRKLVNITLGASYSLLSMP
jgi:outer membrane protein with beta-barrel domain